jgi:hypothetical protein
MTVRRGEDGAIVLDGTCPVEDTEPLLQMLQETPQAPIDWTGCRQIHTAVFQLVLASGAVPPGTCGDAWVQQWLAPRLRRNGKKG